MVEFIFGFLSEIFTFFLSFVLVFALVYGVLSKTKIVSSNEGINSTISFVIALLFALSGAFKFFIKIIPFFAVMVIMFAGLFIVLSLLRVRPEEVIKYRIVRLTIAIIAVFFVVFTAWNMYYDEIQEQRQLLFLESEINETQLEANLTGNPFIDVPLRYEYQCTRQGKYLSPILFFGQGGVLCIFLHPRVIGVVILLPLLAWIIYLISRKSLLSKEARGEK